MSRHASGAIVMTKNHHTGMALGDVEGEEIQASSHDERLEQRDHSNGESMQLLNDDESNATRQWEMRSVGEPSSRVDAAPGGGSVQSESERGNAMLVDLRYCTASSDESWYQPPALEAIEDDSTQTRLGDLLRLVPFEAYQLLQRRFLEVASRDTRGDIASESVYNNHLLDPMPESHNVWLFAHHDICMYMTEMFNHNRENPDVFANIINGLGKVIRGEKLQQFLLQPMVPQIIRSILELNSRDPIPELAELPQGERNSWRDHVPLPLICGYRAVNGEKASQVQDQVGPLNVWELFLLFFRIIEAHVEFEHGVGLSHFTISYRAVLVTPDSRSSNRNNECRLVDHNGRPELLRYLRGSNTLVDVGMWHVLTFCDESQLSEPRIPDFHIGFVLHSSDPFSHLATYRPSPREPAISFPPSGRMARDFDPDRVFQTFRGPHYHLTMLPANFDDYLSRTAERVQDLPIYTHLLREGFHFYLDPEAVNGLEPEREPLRRRRKKPAPQV